MGLKTRMMKARRHGQRAEDRSLKRQMRKLPSRDPMDPGFRRLFYCRYADLCRRRHKSAYADLWVMPMGLLESLPEGQSVAL